MCRMFLKDCAGKDSLLKSLEVRRIGYRKAEALDALDDASLRWPLEFRGTGASRVADGSFDVRSLSESSADKSNQT